MKRLILLAVIVAGTSTYAKAQVAININAGFNVWPHRGVVYAQPVYGRPYPRPCAPLVYAAPPHPVYYAPAPVVYVEKRGYYGGKHYNRGCGWKSGHYNRGGGWKGGRRY